MTKKFVLKTERQRAIDAEHAEIAKEYLALRSKADKSAEVHGERTSDYQIFLTIAESRQKTAQHIRNVCIRAGAAKPTRGGNAMV